jgi:hypothetical protein
MPLPIYYLGTVEEVAHHARPLQEAFDVRIVTADEARRLARPGEVCVLFNEFYPRFRDACLDLKDRGCPTLYALDGILEWRNSWELPEKGDCCLWVMRPVLSHKAACIGRSQARIIESWGNLGQCEVVGVPRFDSLAGRQPRRRDIDQPFRVLIITAKCPGFTPQQVACTQQSLLDLRDWFATHPNVNGVPLQPVWRITQGLEQSLGIQNQLADTTGKDLASVLNTVDAVITTPSTAMLEGMLQGVPVALLDYHNRPHYVPAAWSITSAEHMGAVLSELMQPSPARLLYQESILHDALECHTPATPRLVELIQRMASIAASNLAKGEALSFPRRVLTDSQAGHHMPEPRYDHAALFPARLLFTGSGQSLSMTEAIERAEREGFRFAQRQAHSADVPSSESHSSESETWLDRAFCSPHQWRDVPDELHSQWQAELQRATAPLARELRAARRELQLVERQRLRARLARLGQKIGRALRWAKPQDDNKAA